ncbi:1-acylglycerol-3-phosphate O-acyltransferase [Papiliotrema laurentii]|uniref:1-acyl-sn-glycerol-3-phosphate acyltransferase n=1 Tax=Papiliotrema laurentii TaxID=5418 RepID=A0AAD9CVE5_PAPLA|nr:1-acylglycerol-3-phosphate O-acyltransferase [Papiliotrema laurentii]
MLGWVLKPLAVASTVVISTLGLLSRKYQRARLYYHLGLYLSTLGAASAWGVLITIVATLTGKRFNINYYVARSFYTVCSPLIGIKVDVEGEEHLSGLVRARGGKGQSAVLVGNHQSLLDVLYLGRILPKRASIMAKKELKWTPLLGQFMALSGAVFVDRKNRTAAVDALEKAGEEMKRKGVSLWVFPEGTRSSTPDPILLPFKKGAFHLAVKAQVPIIPVVTENYHRLFDGKTRMEEGSLKIRVLPPVSTQGLTADDVTALTESTRESMLVALREISQPGPDGDKTAKVRAIEARSSTPEETEPARVEPESRQASVEPVGSEGGKSRSSEDGTEDEMDEDAVLLKRPREPKAESDP